MMKTLRDLIDRLVERQKVLLTGDEMDIYAAAVIEREVKELKIEYQDILREMMFKLIVYGIEGELINTLDQSMTKKQLENMTIIQPLELLSPEQMEEFAKALYTELNPNHDAPILLLPFDVKILKVRGILPVEE